MGNHTICETILLGPWYLREGVTQAVLPIEELDLNGSAHVKVPESLVSDLEGPCQEWLGSAPDGASSEFRNEEFLTLLQGLVPDAVFAGSNLRRIDWEWNNWHYDICPGLTDSDTYDIQSTLGPEQRWNIPEQSLLCTVPFPTSWHGPTVTVPWEGAYKGKSVQAPPGYTTIFDFNRTWHRGDRWEGAPRGVLMISFKRKGELNTVT